MDNGNTYINILISTLAKKDSILDELLIITNLQKVYLAKDTDKIESIENFNDTIEQKDKYIKQLNQLDDGFNTVYERVKKEITGQKEQYKQEILQLQALIQMITDKSVKLQVLEQKNKLKFDIAFVSSKKEIKEYKKSNQSVTKYYKNMTNQYENESYFLDRKK